VDFVDDWKQRAEVTVLQLLTWLGVPEGTFYGWKERYGQVNEHNRWIPRAHWLTDRDRQAILNFHREHPLESYRQLTRMMRDAKVVAASAASVYRVLKRAGTLSPQADSESKMEQ
jgi:hypothetical protein